MAIGPGIKLIALTTIIGVSAYVLLVPDPDTATYVSARQDISTAPIPAVRATVTESEPVSPVPSAPRPTEATPGTALANVGLVAKLPAALEKATSEQKTTAEHLLRFASSGAMSDIHGLSSDQVRSLADLLTTELGNEAVAAAVESYFGLPAAEFLRKEDPAGSLTELFDAVQNEPTGDGTAPIIFTDQVEPNGRVQGAVHVIPAGAQRVYAAFENAGPLQGLNRVLAVWRNPSDDRMVFTEFEPIREGSVYNYVWLELDEGWVSGHYKLDLFHPEQPSQLLASRSFNVR